MDTRLDVAGTVFGSSKTDRYSYLVLTLLWLVALFRLVDLQIISVLLNSIRLEMGFSDTQLGLLSGFAFAVFYAVLGIPIAYLADRYSRKTILAVCLGLWSVMTALCGAATGYLSFFLARMGVGIGEAGGYPASASLLSDYFPPQKRGFVFAVLGSAIPVGVFVAFIVGGYINEHYGWRAAYLAIGMPGVILAVLVQLFVREPARGASESRLIDRTREPVLASVKGLFNRKSYVFVILASAFANMAATGSGIWMASFYIRVHGMGSAEVGTAMGVMYGAGGLAGTILGGVAADWLTRKYNDSRYFLKVCSISTGCLLPFVGFMFTAQSLSFVLLFHFVVIIFMHMNFGPTLAMVQNLAGISRRSMSQAINVLTSNLLGLSLGPLIVGVLSDRFSPVYGDIALGYSIMAIFLFGYFFAALSFFAADKCEGRLQRETLIK